MVAGKVIDFPRKLEWTPIETWIGRVQGTALCTKVSQKLEGVGFFWESWNGHVLVQAGEAGSMEEARTAAEKALEGNVLVVRPLPPSQEGVF